LQRIFDRQAKRTEINVQGDDFLPFSLQPKHLSGYGL
jgi:hypothetical protein